MIIRVSKCTFDFEAFGHAYRFSLTYLFIFLTLGYWNGWARRGSVLYCQGLQLHVGNSVSKHILEWTFSGQRVSKKYL